MKITKIYSEVETGEKLYSVLMSEEEYVIFSDNKKSKTDKAIQGTIAAGTLVGTGAAIAGNKVLNKEIEKVAKKHDVRVVKDSPFVKHFEKHISGLKPNSEDAMRNIINSDLVGDPRRKLSQDIRAEKIAKEAVDKATDELKTNLRKNKTFKNLSRVNKIGNAVTVAGIGAYAGKKLYDKFKKNSDK